MASLRYGSGGRSSSNGEPSFSHKGATPDDVHGYGYEQREADSASSHFMSLLPPTHGGGTRSGAHTPDQGGRERYAFSTSLRREPPVSPNPLEAFYPPATRRGTSGPLDLPSSSPDNHEASNLSASAIYTHLSLHDTLIRLDLPTDTTAGNAKVNTDTSSISKSTTGSDSATYLHLLHGLHSPIVPLRRSRAGGPNEFLVRPADPPWRKFLAQLSEPLILLLLGSAAVSLVIGETDDAMSIALAVIVVVTVGWVQEQRSEKSLEALGKLVPHYCHLVRDGTHAAAATTDEPGATTSAAAVRPAPRKVLANTLVPGDVVTFSAGDRVPADVRLFSAVQLEVDESTLTGEVKPRRKNTEVVGTPLELPRIQEWERSAMGGAGQGVDANVKTGINDRDNIVFMGTLVKSGYGRGVVIATGSSTELGLVFSMVDEVVERRTPLQLSMDELAQKLSMVSFAVIGVICLMGVVQRRSWLEMFTIGVSLAVAAIPEGLPIVVTVTLALGVLRMSHRKAIVKRLPSVETLGSVSVICSDKTGTLTSNEMTVVRVYTLEDGVIDISKDVAAPAVSRSLARSLLVGGVCNNSHRDEHGKNVGQATDVAMVNVLRRLCQDDPRPYFQRTAEVPFDSETKCMSVTGRLSAPPIAGSMQDARETTYVKGAYEVVLERCASVLGADGKSVDLTEDLRRQIHRVAQDLSSHGLRILATATCAGPSPLASATPRTAHGDRARHTLTFCGLQAMQDPPRKGVRESIVALSESGVHVVMITGDAESTAVAIAEQLGLLRAGPQRASASARPEVMTGKQIDALTERQLQECVSSVSVFARTTPRHKMSIVAALQANGQIVGMTGDGVNDAPALKMADIGISMGLGGTDVAKEAADVILVDDNFATILSAVEEGKGIFFNIQNFLAFQLSTAVAALTLITLSTACQLKLPLNPMQILFINILMDGPPSQSLGVDPVDRSIMRKPPRAKDAPVLNRQLMHRIIFSASIIVLGTLYIYVHELSKGLVDQRDQTMTFTCFVLLDLTSAVQNRGLTTPLMGNRMLTLTVGISFCTQLAMIYVAPLQGIFQTQALALSDLLLLFFLCACSFAAHEARRLYERKLHVDTRDQWEERMV
ncbi:calcium-transporting P [Tilletiaria anomala UBC 951]|uniref:Calcium-transporting ATPase n=1 Tax=Tilletiaria anomala (strain ATCC 24038 / CBS 436.72 / UBC 951) TaxID=1037660 RepID=A0A066VJ42_TILAU|nr:calcium-transporting P [Tilletiaria anomala UBC 951]KDN41511.1 calcium-transporting P [Tilletiaria anomala UBC 951]